MTALAFRQSAESSQVSVTTDNEVIIPHLVEQ